MKRMVLIVLSICFLTCSPANAELGRIIYNTQEGCVAGKKLNEIGGARECAIKLRKCMRGKYTLSECIILYKDCDAGLYKEERKLSQLFDIINRCSEIYK